jgi:HNH endonuclease
MKHHQISNYDTLIALLSGPRPANPAECIIWPRGGSKAGYGLVAHNGVSHYVHRFAYEHFNGPIGEGRKHICHTCDNPRCFRIEHLFLGTSRDNHLDCLRKGRGNKAFGERAGKAKLTESQVLEMRRLHSEGIGVTTLGRMFGVYETSALMIVRRRTWKHL